MQILCDGLDLSDAVLKVSKAIANRTTNPILEGIKLVAEENELTLCSTDLELYIEKKIRAEVKVEGETVVPGRVFSEFVKKLTNEKIGLTANDKNQLKISYVDSEGVVQCYQTDEYPSFKSVDTASYFGITKANLKNLINKTIFSVAIDSSKPILKGVLFEIDKENISAVSSDGYRISYIKKQLAFSNIKANAIIPERSLREISKFMDDSDDIINVYVQPNFVMVDLGDTKIITRLLEGEFLNYKQIIESSHAATTIVVSKEQLVNSLERASILGKSGLNNAVMFNISESKLCLSSTSDVGSIKENLNISLEGKDLVIAFNAKYIMEPLRANENEFIKIEFNESSNNPCTIKPVEDEEFLYLILPVRLFN